MFKKKRRFVRIKYFDFKRIERFILENRSDIKELAICIAEDKDEVWEQIIHNGELIQYVGAMKSCAGVRYSAIGTPAIYVEYYNSQDRDGQMISAYYTGYYDTVKKVETVNILGGLMNPRLDRVFSLYK